MASIAIPRKGRVSFVFAANQASIQFGIRQDDTPDVGEDGGIVSGGILRV